MKRKQLLKGLLLPEAVNSTSCCNSILLCDADFKERKKENNNIYLIMKQCIFIVGKLDVQRSIKKNHPNITT